MVSRTRVTKNRRRNRNVNMGKKRKNYIKNHGSTPKFEVHVEKTQE